MTPLEVSVFVMLALVTIAFVSGIGITTIGPGGIFVTIALFSLTSLPSAEVAGTAHLTFVATGIVGSFAYLRSGEFSTGPARTLVVLLSGSCIVGALAGAVLNQFVTRETFGVLLGVVAVTVGVTILYRERRGLLAMYELDLDTRQDRFLLVGIGSVLGLVSGLLGIGGPVLAVPALVLLGVPMLLAVAVAQVQSIFIASVAAGGYLYHDSVSVAFAILVGVPLLGGVLIGWQIAHRVDPTRLTILLGIVLIMIGPYLAF